MTKIAQNLTELHNNLPPHVTLVAVSKTKTNEDIMEAYSAGQRIFGENYIQELCDKYATLPKDIQWHMIGHLQRNKVKYIAAFIDLIHGVDSLSLLLEINKQAAKNNRVINVLLQVYIAEEESKFGFESNELKQVLQQIKEKPLSNVRVRGLMGMASFSENQEQLKKEFSYLSALYREIKSDYFSTDHSFDTLSMGMSGDYMLAIQCGSTMVRIGSAIFGSRS
jgi:hypothetical protein